MEITLTRIPVEDKSVLGNLLELYSYELSDCEGDDVSEHGLYGYSHLDNYWTEEGRHAFLIRVDGKIAGFVLVREIANQGYFISEFFVMKKFRRGGVGKTVAHRVFDTFPGQWTVREMRTNLPAHSFWRKVIGEYTANQYEETTQEDWDGPVQRFVRCGARH